MVLCLVRRARTCAAMPFCQLRTCAAMPFCQLPPSLPQHYASPVVSKASRGNSGGGWFNPCGFNALCNCCEHIWRARLAGSLVCWFLRLLVTHRRLLLFFGLFFPCSLSDHACKRANRGHSLFHHLLAVQGLHYLPVILLRMLDGCLSADVQLDGFNLRALVG
jgi:hypothetical protein